MIPTRTRQAARWRADLLLLMAAGIWGSAFVAQRVAAQSMGAYLFDGVRFVVGGLVLLPLAIWIAPRRFDKKNILPVITAGLLLFTGASAQQLGLRHTTAGNAGFITGLYVVLIPLIQVFFLRHPTRRVVWLASLLAAAGLYLLSTGGQFRVSSGDLLELVAALLWALHVLWIERTVRRMDVLHLTIGQNFICGALSLAVALTWEGSALHSALQGWLPILYTGILSIAVGYTLQAVGQKVAPAADAAIILSFEAVFAAIGGWLLLNERLTPLQLMGSGLMFSGMIISQLPGGTSPADTAHSEAEPQ